MASYIEFEMDEKTIKLEFNRDSIIKMEEMGYNAIDPTSKVMTNYEIMVYGGLLKHQPNTKWKDALVIADFLSKEYGMTEVVKHLSVMTNEVFHLEGKPGKILVRKGIQTQA